MTHHDPRQYTALLVPLIRSWTDEELVYHNLRYGPHQIDPNLANDPNLGPGYVNGWYDDDRSIDERTFDQAMTRIKAFDDEIGLTEQQRVDEAWQFWDTNQCYSFLKEIQGLYFPGKKIAHVATEIISFMTTEHVHCWHRFRMIPESKIRRWQIPSLTMEGLDELSRFPMRIRRRNNPELPLLAEALRRMEEQHPE